MAARSNQSAPEVTRYAGESLDFEEEWCDLAVRAGSYFQTPAWVLSWWRHLADTPETMIATWRSPDGELDGVAFASRVRERIHPKVPLTVGLWVNSGSGPGAGDHLGFPTVPDRRSVAHRWFEAHAGTKRMGHVCGDSAPNGAGWQPIATTPTFELAIAPEGRLLNSKSTEKDLQRCERRLAEAGIEVEVSTGPDITPEIIDALLDLHAERFAALGETSFFGGWRRPQLLELCERGHDHARPVATVARLGDRIVGVDWAFMAGTTLHSYQSGWSQEYRRHSLGSVLILRSMRWGRDNGLTRIDFLRGAEEFKERFGATAHHDQSLLMASGSSGWVLRGKAIGRRFLRKASA